MVGIIGAMDIEIENIQKFMVDIKKKKIGYTEFVQGYLMGQECVMAKSGIGKVHAAACTQAMILTYSPDFIINTGIAGALSDDVKCGDLVLADKVVQHDMDLTVFGDKPGFIQGPNIVEIPCSDVILKRMLQLLLDSRERVHVGTIATGDQFISDRKKYSEIAQTFSAIACDMESASVGQVCFINDIPFMVVRVVSDGADTGTTSDYKEFKFIAAKKSIDFIFKFFADV